jgi:hypothetical protein
VSEATFDIFPKEACKGKAHNTLDQHLKVPKKQKELEHRGLSKLSN